VEKRLKQFLKGGTFTDVNTNRSYTMSRIRGKNNASTEIRFKMALVRSKLKGWTLNCGEMPGKPDVYFPFEKVAIFIDGCYWHGCPKCGHIPKTRSEFWEAKIKINQERDVAVDNILTTQGVRVVRIWEHELVNNHLLYNKLNRIIKYLGVE